MRQATSLRRAGNATSDTGIGTQKASTRYANTPATATGSGAPQVQIVTDSTRVSSPAPASGPVRRVKSMPVAKPTNSAAPFISYPKAASPANTAQLSAAQNRAMP